MICIWDLQKSLKTGNIGNRQIQSMLSLPPGGRSLMVWSGSPRCGSRHLAQRCQVRTPGKSVTPFTGIPAGDSGLVCTRRVWDTGGSNSKKKKIYLTQAQFKIVSPNESQNLMFFLLEYYGNKFLYVLHPNALLNSYIYKH